LQRFVCFRLRQASVRCVQRAGDTDCANKQDSSDPADPSGYPHLHLHLSIDHELMSVIVDLENVVLTHIASNSVTWFGRDTTALALEEHLVRAAALLPASSGRHIATLRLRCKAGSPEDLAVLQPGAVVQAVLCARAVKILRNKINLELTVVGGWRADPGRGLDARPLDDDDDDDDETQPLLPARHTITEVARSLVEELAQVLHEQDQQREELSQKLLHLNWAREDVRNALTTLQNVDDISDWDLRRILNSVRRMLDDM
jgi:hypothetical protein